MVNTLSPAKVRGVFFSVIDDIIGWKINQPIEVITMKLTKKDISLFEELVAEFLYQHPQLNEIQYDDDGNPYEYREGYVSYDSYGPLKINEINQLSSKLKSLI